jgi:hypothetical protein
MNAKTHPIPKTSVDLRRSIARLETFQEASPFDPYVQNGLASQLAEKLKEVRALIPKDLRDPDLLENQKTDD